jgi:hypothetical protein
MEVAPVGSIPAAARYGRSTLTLYVEGHHDPHQDDQRQDFHVSSYQQDSRMIPFTGRRRLGLV